MANGNIPLDKARAITVIDLGFGDAGKGLSTDYFVRKLGATAVVRFNGGAQAGHNVVTTDGVHHCFSQFGAGTFSNGVTTWLGPNFVLHPTGLLSESNRLAALGIRGPLSRLHVHERCPIITPYHQALGRLRELSRGQARHGSCGVGFGEAVADVRNHRPHLVAADLLDVARARKLLSAIEEHKRDALSRLIELDVRIGAVHDELSYFSEAYRSDAWLQQASALARSLRILRDETWHQELATHRYVVFEGAQGLLLDEDHGFFPHTTYSRCDFTFAESIASRCGFGSDNALVGITRAFSVRHGAGPLPSELPELNRTLREPHNTHGPWQGSVRVGALDLVLLKYARARLETQKTLDGLFVTHLDQVTPHWQWVRTYASNSQSGSHHESMSLLTPREVPSPADWHARQALTTHLERLRISPEYLALSSRTPGSEFAEMLRQELDIPHLLGSFGPSVGSVVDRGTNAEVTCAVRNIRPRTEAV